MRGTPSTVRRAGRRSRIIPAHAGNTSYSDANYMSNWDHPRACGEHEAAVTGGLTDAGSSPRMRGTPSGCRRPTWPPRIIPAHAGNTGRRRPGPPRHRDHPRACGEHRLCADIARRYGDHPRACGEHMRACLCAGLPLGSSPRMRGTRTRKMLETMITGIIPAHAGNTVMLCTDDTVKRDHPRACGEHKLHCAMPMPCRGSSPRMRGTRLRQYL